MKLSDYVFDFVADLGVTHVFMIVGGANAHLADSLGRHKRLKYICCQHEQAVALAAEGYARTSENIGVALVTSGPGGTNAITGVCSSWFDSIPVLVLSGQVPLALTTSGKDARQLGVQQMNIVEVVRSVTKYANMLTNSRDIRYCLEKALYLAKSGRPGPVWLDIPGDIQRAEINPEKIRSFNPPKGQRDKQVLYNEGKVDTAVELLLKAKRPILIGGNGIRLAGAVSQFGSLVNLLKIPVILTWNGLDLLDHSHPLFIGSAGVMGQRGSNFAIANADLILSIGSRLDTRQVGNSPELYAPRAKKIVVDVDKGELKKGLIRIDEPIIMDAREFIRELERRLGGVSLPDVSRWLSKCQEWKRKYPVVLLDYFNVPDKVNSYVLANILSKLTGEGDIVILDSGTVNATFCQAFRIGKNQRMFYALGLGQMGYSLPASIGAWYGGGGLKRIIPLMGDGSLQMNIQELQTLVHYDVPIKIILLNNKSYLTIKNTQDLFFDGRYVGSEPGSGYSTPDFLKIAAAYGIDAVSIANQNELEPKLADVLKRPCPILCEVQMLEQQPIMPISVLDKQSYTGSLLERMYPPLPEEEFQQNMIIPAL